VKNYPKTPEEKTKLFRRAKKTLKNIRLKMTRKIGGREHRYSKICCSCQKNYAPLIPHR